MSLVKPPYNKWVKVTHFGRWDRHKTVALYPILYVS